jgi:integrase
MSGDAHVRFWESAGVQFPRVTHLGRMKRVPLATDKSAAQTLLNEIVKKVEKRKVGLTDTFDEHAATPLEQHIKDFKASLTNKGTSSTQITQVIRRVRRVVEECRFKRLADISPGKVEQFLAKLRTDGLSAQTSNFYLQSINQFSRWMVKDSRLRSNPLIGLSPLNVRTDRRHDRRALTETELAKLIKVAQVGKRVESVDGPTRAMAYKVSMMTGIRRSELGSLTKESIDLDATPPTVTVEAGYSKHRREDVLPLHSSIIEDLRVWLALKKPKTGVFPLFGKRDMAKMMQVDLKSAGIPYRDERGRYADWHALRHSFITMVAKSGVAPATAMQLARHSDINLTLGRYAHVELTVQHTALQTLRGLDESSPAVSTSGTPAASAKSNPVPAVVPSSDTPSPARSNPIGPIPPKNGTVSSSKPGQKVVPRLVPRLVPSGAQNGAQRVSFDDIGVSPSGTRNGVDNDRTLSAQNVTNPLENKANGNGKHWSTVDVTDRQVSQNQLPPARFERTTYGLGNRRSILLSYEGLSRWMSVTRYVSLGSESSSG